MAQVVLRVRYAERKAVGVHPGAVAAAFHAGRELVSDIAQGAVAFFVTVEVVDDLKALDVEHAEDTAAVWLLLEHEGDVVVERDQVRDAGEVIGKVEPHGFGLRVVHAVGEFVVAKTNSQGHFAAAGVAAGAAVHVAVLLRCFVHNIEYLVVNVLRHCVRLPVAVSEIAREIIQTQF